MLNSNLPPTYRIGSVTLIPIYATLESSYKYIRDRMLFSIREGIYLLGSI